MTEREVFPVITWNGLKEVLVAKEKITVEVECKALPVASGGQVKGNWRIWILLYDSSGAEQKLVLVTQRDIKPREFKTLSGLYSIWADLGASLFIVPNKVGQTVTWELDAPVMQN